MDDDQKILQEIAKYAGEINKYKNAEKLSAGRGRAFGFRSYRPPPAKQYYPRPRPPKSVTHYRPLPSVSAKSSTHRNKVLDLAKIRAKFERIGHPQASRKDCLYYNQTGLDQGICKFKSCPFEHVPIHVTICQEYLVGKCTKPSAPDTLGLLNDFQTMIKSPPEDYCKFSHIISVNKMPLCVHYLHGQCQKQPCFNMSQAKDLVSVHHDQPISDQCMFIHVKKTLAPICKTFSKGYYCSNGPFDCSGRHLMLCRRDGCDKASTCPFLHLSNTCDEEGGDGKKHWKREINNRNDGVGFISLNDFVDEEKVSDNDEL